jgi:hypothetical protein
MANQTFSASIGIARRSSAPLDSILGPSGVYYWYAPGAHMAPREIRRSVAIIIGSC